MHPNELASEVSISPHQLGRQSRHLRHLHLFRLIPPSCGKPEQEGVKTTKKDILNFLNETDFKYREIVLTVLRQTKIVFYKIWGISLEKPKYKSFPALALTSRWSTAHLFMNVISLALTQGSTQVTWCQHFSGSVKGRQQCEFLPTHGWSQQISPLRSELIHHPVLVEE